MEPCDLVLFRSDGNRAEATFEPQILNKTGAGALILNQDGVGAMKVRQFPQTLFELGVLHPGSKNVQQVIVVVPDEPGGADRVIIDLLSFGGGVPALDNTATRHSLRRVTIKLEVTTL